MLHLSSRSSQKKIELFTANAHKNEINKERKREKMNILFSLQFFSKISYSFDVRSSSTEKKRKKERQIEREREEFSPTTVF